MFTLINQAARRLLQAVEAPEESLPAVVEPSAPAMLPIERINRRDLADQVFTMGRLRQAWRKVRANGGGPGVDGERIYTFESALDENLLALRAELLAGQYQPQQVKRVWIPKSSGGARPLSILAVRDRIAQRAMAGALMPFYEGRFLDSSYAFREGRSTVDAVQAIASHRDRGRRWVVDGDIRKCFENIDHGLLMSLMRRNLRDVRVLKLIEGWLKAQVFNESAPVEEGVSQGGVISPLLSNIYLHEFDQAMRRAGLSSVRYADDWVVLCAHQRAAQHALGVATHALGRLRLRVNPDKTRVCSFDEGFSFVGAFFIRDEVYWISPGAQTLPALSPAGAGVIKETT